jgi:hypothetical protein
MRFAVKLDNVIIGHSDLEHHGDRSMGGAIGRFVPAPAYAAVRHEFAERVSNWVPMPNLTLWQTGGGPVECVGGVMVKDYSIELGEDVIELSVAGISDPSYDELFPDWREHESRRQRNEIEALLVKAIEAYLPLHGSPHGSEDPLEQKPLKQVCSALDRLLAAYLRETEEWSPDYWNDGILASAQVPSPGVLDLTGLAIWAKDAKSGFYWEPFSAVVRVSEQGNQLIDYQLKFADAAWGLGKVPYNTHPRGWNCAPPQKWLFEFSRSN